MRIKTNSSKCSLPPSGITRARSGEKKRKIPDEHVFFFLYFVLISLLKLLRRFGKYWQYGSKLKDSFVISFFGLLRIVALGMPVSVAFVALSAITSVEGL